MRWAEFDTEDTVGNRLDKPLSFLQRADLDWGSRCGGSVVMDVAQDDLMAVVTRPGPPCSPCWGSPGQPAVRLSTSSDSVHRGHSHLGTEEQLAELEGRRMAMNKQTQYMFYSLLSPVFGEGCCLLPRPRIITDMRNCSESFHAY